MTHPDPILAAFAGGFTTAGLLGLALFFLYFWRRTGDSLFVAFSISFLLFALNQALPVLLGVPSERQASIYLLRLAAFGLIIFAIVRKNLKPRPRPLD